MKHICPLHRVILSPKLNTSGMGPQQMANNSDKCGFSRTIGAGEQQGLSTVHVEADSLKYYPLIKLLGNGRSPN
jgi:hypothetical protein